MVAKTITQIRKAKDDAAIRAAKYRQEHANRPDVRAVDKAISEAVSIYSKDLSAAEAAAFLRRIIELATAGLEFKGYGPKSSKSRSAKRLQTWISPAPTSGSVRTAVMRDALIRR